LLFQVDASTVTNRNIALACKLTLAADGDIVFYGGVPPFYASRFMNQSDTKTGEAPEIPSQEGYSARLLELQRREWWTWGVSVIVMLLLTTGVASLAFPTIMEGEKSPWASNVFQSVAGLVFLIVVFGAYLTYEKFLINRLRIEIAERQVHSAHWRNLALVDPLTGLYNRRFMERTLKAEIGRALRKHYELTVAVFDLNKFKAINDRLGHPAGDLVLKAFAEHLSTVIREADTAARLGGDEFMLVLPECNASQVPAMLRRLEPISVDLNGEKVPIKFAVGWAEYRRGQEPQELIAEADRALYEDKENRRNPLPAAVSA
jgi:diguanylate cyclase (GGDEF)-like protein